MMLSLIHISPWPCPSSGRRRERSGNRWRRTPGCWASRTCLLYTSTGLCGGAALLGAGFGYLTLLGFSDALRYLSAAILTFAVGFAFYDMKLFQRPWTMPGVAGLMNGCTGFIYLSQGCLLYTSRCV